MTVVGSATPLPPLSQDDTSRWLRLVTPLPAISLVGPVDGSRAEVEQHVAARYDSTYGARLTHFLPWFLRLQCLGRLTGVVGMQAADEHGLFLERYLDRPVEKQLAERLGHGVPRGALVEIGNLVADKRGASQLLFLLFTAILHTAGYEWIVFTATRSLRNNLEKLGFPLLELQRVDAAALAPELVAQWGSYYHTEPTVMAGSLAAAMELGATQPLLRRVLRLYQGQIATLALQLKRV
jgi:hypothetical protein